MSYTSKVFLSSDERDSDSFELDERETTSDHQTSPSTALFLDPKDAVSLNHGNMADERQDRANRFGLRPSAHDEVSQNQRRAWA